MRHLPRQQSHYWLWLGLAIVLAVLPHARFAPIWMPVSCVVLVLSKLFLVYTGRPRHRGWAVGLVRNLLAAGLVFGVYLNYGSLLGRDAGVALLIVLAGFKFLESQRDRDIYVVTALGLFLIVTNFFFSQTIGTAGYMLLVVLCLLAGLIDHNDPRRSLPVRYKLRHAGVMLAQALPLMIIVFVLFPRVPGPLWGIPDDAHAGTTGLDEFMTPGSISVLSDSSEVAFRVEFEGEAPPPSEMYWRGPVLWETDGRKWTPGKSRDRGNVEALPRGESVDYQITIEPHNRKWIFALEMPTTAPGETQFNHDYQLLYDDRIHQRRRFDLTAYTDYRLIGADNTDFERALALPPNQHPKTVALAQQWREQGLDTQAIIDKALAMFHNQTFYYTLSPPLLNDDTIDQFLFETKEGFCEHYAAAFTVLMRAADIPTRIVTGYQGGELNPVGDYYIVRQRDAHAWTEVWVNDSWQRVDPTEAVSPARIRDGINTALPESADEPLGMSSDSWLGQTVAALRNNWDAINNQWNQWVLGYTQDRQRTLLGNMGIDYDNWQELALWLAIAIGLFLGAAGLWILSQGNGHTDTARRLYNRFCKKLGRAGLPRRSYEGPRDFANRAQNHFNNQAEAIQRITEHYIAIRYADRPTADIKLLRYEVNRFQPRRGR